MAKRQLTKKPSEMKGKKAAGGKAKAESDKEEDKAEEEKDDEDKAEEEENESEGEGTDTEQEDDSAPEDDEESAEEEDTDEDKAQASVRTRIRSIMKSEAAQGQTHLADHLAFNTGLSAKAAVAILKAAAKDKATASTTNQFAAAMATIHNPTVKAGAVNDTASGRLLSKVAKRFSQKK